MVPGCLFQDGNNIVGPRGALFCVMRLIDWVFWLLADSSCAMTAARVGSMGSGVTTGGGTGGGGTPVFGTKVEWIPVGGSMCGRGMCGGGGEKWPAPLAVVGGRALPIG